MTTQMTYYVRLRSNTPFWKKWLIDKLSWYQYNIAWKQQIWVVYDMMNKKDMYPGGLTNSKASNERDRLEDLRRNLVL